jgi:2-keto-4-pentenoate hydratase
MTDAFDPEPAARPLAEVLHGPERIAELPQAIRSADIGQGYDVQDRLVELLGEPVVGWKRGVGSTKLKQQSGVGRSIAGRVLGTCRYEPGATVRLSFAAPVTIEFEIAFVLGKDIDHRSAVDIKNTIAETRVTFELLIARFIDRRSVGWPSFAADDSGFEALIVGEQIDERQIPELLSSLAVSVDGQERARAAVGDDATDPYGALADLFATKDGPAEGKHHIDWFCFDAFRGVVAEGSRSCFLSRQKKLSFRFEGRQVPSAGGFRCLPLPKSIQTDSLTSQPQSTLRQGCRKMMRAYAPTRSFRQIFGGINLMA